MRKNFKKFLYYRIICTNNDENYTNEDFNQARTLAGRRSLSSADQFKQLEPNFQAKLLLRKDSQAILEGWEI